MRTDPISPKGEIPTQSRDSGRPRMRCGSELRQRMRSGNLDHSFQDFSVERRHRILWRMGQQDTFTLSGDYEHRVLEVLRVAQHQVRLAQAGAAPRMQAALIGLEDALSDQIAWLENAAAGDEAD